MDFPSTGRSTPAGRRRSGPRPLTLAASIVAVVALTGCGGGSDPAGLPSDLDTAADRPAPTTAGDDGGAALQATTAGGTGSAQATDPAAIDPVDHCPGASATDIRFQSGGTSATLDITASAGQIDLYTLDVRADQILTIILDSTDPAAAATLLTPDGDIPSARFTAQTLAPTRAGTYRICVDAGSTGADYRLEVSVIDDNTPIRIDAPWCGDTVNDRGEIRFAPGATSGSVEQSVLAGERDLYSFEARAEQFIEVFTTSLEDNAVFTVRTPSRDALATETAALRTILPEDGAYEICVGSIRGNASYELGLSITTLES